MIPPAYTGTDPAQKLYSQQMSRYVADSLAQSVKGRQELHAQIRDLGNMVTSLAARPLLPVRAVTTGSNIALKDNEANLILLIDATSNIDVTVPNLAVEGKVVIVSDSNSAGTITVKDPSAATIKVLSAGQSITVSVDSTGVYYISAISPGIDPTAIHVDIAGEIAAITEKVTPVGADKIVIEDSEDSDSKNSMPLSKLLFLSHDGFADFVADEHVAHSGVDLSAGNGLTGGGTIAASRTFDIDADLMTQFGYWYGTFLERFSATISEAGGTVTMSLEKAGGGDLTMVFSDGFTVLDTTPAATIALTVGSDSSPQVNYVYILKTGKVLVKSTSAWPSAEHIRIGFFFCQSAASVQAVGGTFLNQNWNDFAANEVGQGHMTHTAERLRLLGADYFSGIDGNGTTGYLTVGVGNTEYKSTAGVVYQMHRHTFVAFDTSAGDEVHVKNWSGDTFHVLTDLFDITADSTGTTITNNKYFNLVLWGVANQTGEHQTVMINLPSGFYNKQIDAEQDVSGHDDFSIPREFGIDSSTGFLIVRITIKMGATWTHVSEVDLRGTTPQNAAGGASAASTAFADNTFNVFDESDDTKILAFDVGALVSTGQTRTVTIPDADTTLLTQAQVDWLDQDVKVASGPTFDDLTTTGKQTHRYLSITGALTLGDHYMVDCQANTFDVTLPAAITIAGRIYHIKNSGSGTITLKPALAENIDDEASQTIETGECISVVSDGVASWLIF